MTLPIFPIILSGGSGTRLWPLSRSLFPKQLLPMTSDLSMLQQTAARGASADGYAAPIVVSGEDHRFMIARQLREQQLEPAAILLEPEGRNTAAAIAIAAHWVAANSGDGETPMLVMPSDHVIADVPAFHAAVAAALPAARSGRLVTFGIRPDQPETGYGYIEVGEPLGDGVHAVARFVEKPDLATAQAYVDGGRHLWNGGIFLFTARAYLDSLSKHAAEVAAACAEAMEAASSDGIFVRPETAAFRRCPDISVDYAVMEKSRDTAVVPVEMGWSDVGSWNALWAISSKDGHGNAVKGDVIAVDSESNLLRVEGGPQIAALGVNDLVIISTRDAVLVVPRERSQDVKKLVDALKKDGKSSATAHSIVHRPWGTYETTDRGDRFQTKHIVVNPGEQLSLQMHHHRAEHWIVVSGTAKVTVDDKVTLLQENQSTYVPAGATHRLENPGRIPLRLIEVQCGPYLGEDDIVRFEDSYGRLDAQQG